MKKTAPYGVRAVLMGPLREIRTKKTAPRGSIKDEKRPRQVDLLRTEKTVLAGFMFLVQSSGDPAPAGNNALDGFLTPTWRGLF